MRRSVLQRRTPLRTRWRDTGPSRHVRVLVRARSGGRCEFPGCDQLATEVHHRYERGMGGVGPKAPAWVNSPANLLHACHHHNQWASNQEPAEAYQMGWLLRHGDVPGGVPVQTIHDVLPVWLCDDGTWTGWADDLPGGEQ